MKLGNLAGRLVILIDLRCAARRSKDDAPYFVIANRRARDVGKGQSTAAKVHNRLYAVTVETALICDAPDGGGVPVSMACCVSASKRRMAPPAMRSGTTCPTCGISSGSTRTVNVCPPTSANM